MNNKFFSFKVKASCCKAGGRLLGLLLLLICCQMVTAQSGYDPTNPPEPYMRYKLTTAVEPSNAGYSSGDGRYMEGQQANINTSARQNYTFQYWTLNGEKYSEESSFTYTMGSGKAEFVAHYAFTPSDPAEPSLNLKNRLYLTSVPEGCCSFNLTSGAKWFPDSYVYVQAYPSQGYEFMGWYEKGVKISDVASFNYFMTGVDNVTLEARFEYNPTNPDDPFSEGNDPTFLYGDVDRDKIVDVTDAVILNGHYINGTTDELQFTIADVNRDGVIDISDVVEAIQIYLNTKK